MGKNVLIVRGGWDGHTPVESTEVFARQLRGSGCDVEIAETLDAYLDPSLGSRDVIVQCFSLSEISNGQWEALSAAVRGGAGFAGWHGGIIDSFRQNTDYQWMTGGQWVAHPGNCIPSYRVEIADAEHEITRGLAAFDLTDTEQYYMHCDPAVEVLCETKFDNTHGDTDFYRKVTMPYAWTKRWGLGRVFVAAWGHTFKDFEVPAAREIVRRGILWAAR